MQKFATPLEQATTSSLEALQAFTLGQAEHNKLEDEEGVPHLKRAIELDPNFAMAYATLGVVYGNLSQFKQQQENLSKAFELKDRASEREKFYISAHYYSEVGEVDKALAIYEQWKQTYPRDSVPWDNLALGYESTGHPEKALANSTEALRLNPKDKYANANLADAYETSVVMTKPGRSSRKPRPKDWDLRPTPFRFTPWPSTVAIKLGCSARWKWEKGPPSNPSCC